MLTTIIIVTILFFILPTARAGITCYQCNSTTLDIFPTCDNIQRYTLFPETSLDLLIRCPEGSKFCLKKVTTRADGVRETIRGCSYVCPPESDPEVCKTMHEVGCGTLKSSTSSTAFSKVCFCDTDECNSALLLVPKKLYLLSIFTLILTIVN